RARWRESLRGLKRRLLACFLPGRVALVARLAGFAERLAQQGTDRAGGLAAGALTEAEAFVRAALCVVGEPWHEEAEDQEQHTDSYYDSDNHWFSLGR